MIKLSDIAHALYGVLTTYASFISPALSLVFAATFLFYQWVDSEDINEKLMDVVEYCVGMTAAFLSIMFLRFA